MLEGIQFSEYSYLTIMLAKKRGHIALISVHADPAEAAAHSVANVQSAYVRKLGDGLAQRGWQVDIFTRWTAPDQPLEEEHQDGYRTIRLQAGDPTPLTDEETYHILPDVLKAFIQYQSKSGILYPLIHTHNWLSGWVGLELKDRQLIKLIHTHHGLGSDRYQDATTVPMLAKSQIATEKACRTGADRVLAIHPDTEASRSGAIAADGAATVDGLDLIYRSLLNQLHCEFFAVQSVS
jgi:D-inositol-3-phosphate glycosyltransferase